MPARLFFWSLTAALAGFLFGFDTVVISGAEQKIQALWELSSELHGLAISAALWGTVVGSFFGGYPTDRWGRRGTLLAIGVLYVVSALWSALATDVYSFMLARFIGGVGVGISTVAAPLYIAEVSPPQYRGRLAGMFQFNIVFGILVAYLSNSLLANLGENAWRWMLGVEAIPAVAYSLLCFFIPESPRWLITVRNDVDSGADVLRQINPQFSQAEIDSLQKEILQSVHHNQNKERFFSAKLSRPILLAFLIAFFNQLSGINAILYFAPRIFELAQVEADAALLQSVGIGITNFIFTFIGLWLIDRMGRRSLLLIGSLGYIASLGACAWAFQMETFNIVPACVFLFIAAHAVGQGAVIWVFISEIFPTQFRAVGQAFGSFTHWIFAALLTVFFPKMVTSFDPAIVFAFFCGMMVLQLVWVLLFVPETKGVPLEEMERKLGISN